MKYSVKSLDATHAQAVYLLAKECLEEAWSEADYRQVLDHPNKQHLGLFESNALIGLVLAYQVDRSADLIAVVISSQRRKQGLGRILLEEFKDQFKPESIFLEVDPENIPAVRLYLGANFQVTGLRKKYYSGKRDAWSMKWQSQIVLESNF